MDNLMVRLFDSGWKFCVYSPENQPHEVHVCSIAEKIVGKPISRAYGSTMSAADLNHAISVIDTHIRFLALPDDATHMANLDDVLQMADEVLDEFGEGKVAIVIDPWNELDHTRPDKMTETEYISYQLSKWRQFHRSRGTHGFLVAHPAKPMPMKDGTYPVPDLYAINGSAHWKNKCDNGIVVWRDENQPGSCEIHIKKVKFKHHGKAGIVRLDYEASTGRYFDPLGYSRNSYANIRSNQFPEDVDG